MRQFQLLWHVFLYLGSGIQQEFISVWISHPSCTSGTVGQYLKGTICTSGKLGGKLYHWPTWTLPELLDLIHRHHDDHQVTAPTPSLGSHGSGEGDSTYFTGERPSPHHLSVLSKFHSFTRFSAKAFQPVHSEGRRPPESLKPSYTRQDLIRSTRPHVQ